MRLFLGIDFGSKPYSRFVPNLTKDNYCHRSSDSVPLIGKWLFELVSFVPVKHAETNHHTMFRFATKNSAMLGHRDAQKILKFLNSPRGKTASEELHKFWLVFPGTVWTDNEGGCDDVPVLKYDGTAWVLKFECIIRDWYKRDLLLVPVEPNLK